MHQIKYTIIVILVLFSLDSYSEMADLREEGRRVGENYTLYSRLKAVGAKVQYKRLKGSHHLVGFTIEGDMARYLLK